MTTASQMSSVTSVHLAALDDGNKYACYTSIENMTTRKPVPSPVGRGSRHTQLPTSKNVYHSTTLEIGESNKPNRDVFDFGRLLF